MLQLQVSVQEYVGSLASKQFLQDTPNAIHFLAIIYCRDHFSKEFGPPSHPCRTGPRQREFRGSLVSEMTDPLAACTFVMNLGEKRANGTHAAF